MAEKMIDKIRVDESNIYKLSNIVRYSQQSKIKQESVAEHSYFVMFFINSLCTEYRVGDTIRLKALEAGLLHDIPEVITNDITYDVKRLIPRIPEILRNYEELIVCEQSQKAYNVLFNQKDHGDIIAKVIVKHADILSVYQYCTNEESLGNKTFAKLREETELRLAESKERLERTLDAFLKLSDGEDRNEV